MEKLVVQSRKVVVFLLITMLVFIWCSDIITKSLQEKAKQSDDEDEEPPPISSDQLLRRASFK